MPKKWEKNWVYDFKTLKLLFSELVRFCLSYPKRYSVLEHTFNPHTVCTYEQYRPWLTHWGYRVSYLKYNTGPVDHSQTEFGTKKNEWDRSGYVETLCIIPLLTEVIGQECSHGTDVMSCYTDIYVTCLPVPPQRQPIWTQERKCKQLNVFHSIEITSAASILEASEAFLWTMIEWSKVRWLSNNNISRDTTYLIDYA